MSARMLKIEDAAFVLTLDPQRTIIRGGSILIEGQKITQVGKTKDLAQSPADRVIDAHNMVITPGFVNGHMHISYAHAVRGIFPDDVKDRLVTVFQLQSAMTEEEEYFTSLLAIIELLESGTTCFMDPGSTKFPDACLQAYEDSGCRIILGECVTDIQEAISRTEQFIKTWDGRLDGRIRAWAMPFSAVNCTQELLKASKHVADEYGVGITLHHSSKPKFRQACLQEHGKLPTEHLEEIGVLGPNMLLAHVLGLEEAEIDCLARTQTSVVMCPSTSLKSGAGTRENCRMPEMLEKGINVALGSDSANSSNHLDIIRSMNLAACMYKDARQNTSLISPSQAVEMGTLMGARAFGLGHELGSIEVGKKADLVLFDSKRPEWQSLIDPLNNLVYSADGRSVHTVIVDGRIVLESYQQSFVDEGPLMEKVQEIGESLLAREGISYPQSWPIV